MTVHVLWHLLSVKKWWILCTRGTRQRTNTAFFFSWNWELSSYKVKDNFKTQAKYNAFKLSNCPWIFFVVRLKRSDLIWMSDCERNLCIWLHNFQPKHLCFPSWLLCLNFKFSFNFLTHSNLSHMSAPLSCPLPAFCWQTSKTHTHKKTHLSLSAVCVFSFCQVSCPQCVRQWDRWTVCVSSFADM